MKRLSFLLLALFFAISIISQIKISSIQRDTQDENNTTPPSISEDEFSGEQASTTDSSQPLPAPARGLKSLSLNFELTKEELSSDSFDKSVQIKLLINEEVITLSLRDYLIGVVAAEMPASFEQEALKAQAVASRSCTIYNTTHSSTHNQADICAQSSCCQAYSTQEKMHAKWGERYEQYYNIIADAVDATDGVCLFYDGELIYAPYHSSSYTATESSGQIWSDKPYLVSVASPDDPENIPNFTVTSTVSCDDFIQCMASAYPDAEFNNGLDISKISLSQSGRVDTVTVNNIAVSGSKLRSLFSLRSTNMEIEQDGDTIIFTTYGWGHGVGMSQYGADSMAADGAGYEAILKWYYTGVELDVPAL